MTKMLKAVRFDEGSGRKEVQISVPDNAYDVLKDYDIDIVDHKIVLKQSSIYLIKDGEDKYSVTFNPNDLNAYGAAFKSLLEQIKEDEKETE